MIILLSGRSLKWRAASRQYLAMSHKIAKLILEQAVSALERKHAIEVAFSLGMTLEEIEEYLDWLDMVRARGNDNGTKDIRH